jgi:trimethylamine--corrinoid protein Co-methyltransferase
LRPTLRFLSDALIERILAEARTILARLGVEIHNPELLRLLGEHGAEIDLARQHARFPEALLDRSLATAPRSFRLHDVLGNETHDFSADNVHFTPGSAALNILDSETSTMRRPKTADYVEYAQLVSRLPHLASQSTAMIPDDVHERISDSYRLYLSLLVCEKPCVTGCFTVGSFGVMRDMQEAVRGTAEELAAKPLTIFSCCPTAPLKWSDVTSQNVMDCARAQVPVEFISMPLSGFMAPVTLTGTLVQHAAETLSGIVISQCARPGAPMLYGGSPAIFDIRRETTPMGAIETMMIDCACSEIGKHLGLPTQAYISLSDAKLLDTQAGLETGIGATLAALSGINSISGPGMLDFESCQSLEKLVVDNEICGMALRLIKGIEPHDDFPSLPPGTVPERGLYPLDGTVPERGLYPLFEELLREKHLLIAKHTRRWLKTEHYFPGPVIDRANRGRWLEEGGLTLMQRAKREKERLVRAWQPSRLPDSTKQELTRLMTTEARRFGMDRLPELPA